VQPGKAQDVHRPEVKRRLAPHHPVGQHPARAAARGDAEGVEAGADIHVGAFRRLAQNEIAVRGKAFRAVDHLLDPGIGQRRHPGDRLHHMLLEMVEIIVEQPELPVVGHLAARGRQIPGLRIGLIAAHHQAADLFLEIGPPVGVAQRRRIRRQPGNPVGDDILVADRLQGHADAGHRAELARPLPGAVDHPVAGDRALVGLDMGDPPRCHAEPRDPHPLDDPRPVHPRAPGQALGDVRGRGLPIARQPACANQIGDIHQGPHRLDLGRRDQVHLHAEAPGRRRQPAVFGPALGIGRQPEAAGHLPAGLEPGLGRQPLVEIDRVFQHLGDPRRGAQLPDQPGRMPGRARGQPALLQQQHLGLVVARQVIGGGTADDAAADDDDLRLRWNGHVIIFP